MKRAVIVHGFQSKPNHGFKPWLKIELEKIGFAVLNPQMPNSASPKQSQWVNWLRQLISIPDKNTYLIGHSLGPLAILRYLESLSAGQSIGGAVFVAGFVEHNLWSDNDPRLDFLKTTLDWLKIKSHCPKFIGLFSDNDPYIPLNNVEIFRRELDAEIILLKQRGHFSNNENDNKLPEVLDAIRKLVHANETT